MRDNLIANTMFVVYDFIKSSGLLYLKSNSFDIEDIINATCEAWIDFLDNRILSPKLKYSLDLDLVRKRFMNKVIKNLNGSKSKSNDDNAFFNLTGLCLTDFSKILIWYIEESSSEKVTFDKFKNYFNSSFDGDVSSTFLLVDKLYNTYFSEVDKGILDEGKIERLNLLLYKCIEDIDNANTKDVVVDDNAFYNLDQKEKRRIINLVLNSAFITKNERMILIDKYGLGEEEALSLGQVAEKYKISKQCVFQQEQKAFVKIRKLSLAKSYVYGN